MSGFKTILVNVDDGQANAARVAAACMLAKRYGAHLEGLYFDPGLQLPTMIDAPLPEEYILRLEQEHRERIAQAETGFKEATSKAGVEAVWEPFGYARNDTLARRANFADLLILGQEPEAETDPWATRGAADVLVIEAACPVLTVPPDGLPDDFGTHVVVGWNASREAARAIARALPLLAAAESVTLLSIGSAGFGDADDGEQVAHERSMRRHLARHGVKASTKTLESDNEPVDEKLLREALDHSATVIVMGAYGHSRLREMVFGGVTRHLLHRSPIALLSAH